MPRQKLTPFILAIAGLFLISQACVARSVIVMIGDGMGFEHVKAGSYYLAGQTGNLCFEPFYRADVTTTPYGGGVTDSAAAGTVMVTGHKVPNGVISQAMNGSPYETVLESARDLAGGPAS